MIELRQGEAGKASTDYDLALIERPSDAACLFGRSLARRRSGRAADADGDRAAALRVDPKIVETFAAWGVRG